MKIPIKAFRDDDTLSWKKRFKLLLAHHEEETIWMFQKLCELEDRLEKARKPFHSRIDKRKFR